jgi:hypothetical protein
MPVRTQIHHLGELAPGSRAGKPLGDILANTAHLAQAKPDRRLPAIACVLFQRAIPVAVPHIHRAHRDAMTLRVLHDLAGAVEAHRLRVEQGAGECGRLVAFQPATGVNDAGEAGRVTFRKAITAEALDLLEQPRRELGGVTAFEHAVHDPLAMFFHAAMALPGRHRTTQLIRFARRIAGRHDRQLHHLLLKQRYAEGAFEHGLEIL